MKLGIANLVTVTGLYFLAVPEVMAIVAMRVLLTGFLFGNGMSIIYSLAGGLLSVLVMAGMKKLKGFSIIGISMAGGIAHNIGQLAVAALCCGELEVNLLSSGTVSRRRGDRIFDRTGEWKAASGCKKGSCKVVKNSIKKCRNVHSHIPYFKIIS